MDLPLSNEIEKEAFKLYPANHNRFMNAKYRDIWIEGAKWMRLETLKRNKS